MESAISMPISGRCTQTFIHGLGGRRGTRQLMMENGANTKSGEPVNGMVIDAGIVE